MIHVPSGSTWGEASRFLSGQEVGLWLLGIYKIYPANFCHGDFSEMQSGSGCSPSPHILH